MFCSSVKFVTTKNNCIDIIVKRAQIVRQMARKMCFLCIFFTKIDYCKLNCLKCARKKNIM